jgi:flagellar biosynthesis/type III secretory pathway protein FliH
MRGTTTVDRMASPYVVKAARLDALRDGDAIREAAHLEAARVRAEAADLLAAAEAEVAAIREDAYASGLAEGAAEAATLIAGAAEAASKFLREREGELREVAFAVAHRILDSLPRNETTLRLAQDALAEYGRDQHLVVRVSPAVADVLRAALDAAPGGAQVTVAVDPALEPGACTLVHPRGRTDIGLIAQFRALMATGQRPQNVGSAA